MFLRIVCVVILICVVAVNRASSHSSIDKLISDYFETEKLLWSLIQSRKENVFTEVEKSFRDVELAGEDDIHLQIKIEAIDKEKYGDQISDIIRNIRYNYQSRLDNPNEINEQISKARNFTVMLFNITSLDVFWDAALETAKVVNTSTSTLGTSRRA